MISNSDIKIWFPTVKAYSGSDTYTSRLYFALKEAGVSVKITWFSHYYELAPFLMSKKIPTDTNIIHTGSWGAFPFYKRGIPLIITMHHNVFEPSFLPYKTVAQKLYHQYLIRHYEKFSIDKASVNIAVSRYTAASYKKTYNIKQPTIIPNWIDTSTFSPPKKKPNNNTFKLLFIGNHTRRKGADLLPKIMDKLGKGYELHTTGGLRGGKTHNQTASYIHHNHIPKTSDLVKLYQSCDALIFPSRLEGFGLAALEAQACGLPVVATNSSAFPEVVINQKTGILCPQDDVEAFVSSIKELKLNPQKRKNMQIKARQHVLDNFSEKKIIMEYITLYKSLFNSSQ